MFKLDYQGDDTFLIDETLEGLAKDHCWYAEITTHDGVAVEGTLVEFYDGLVLVAEGAHDVYAYDHERVAIADELVQVHTDDIAKVVIP
jgi:hypothetical protein